MLNFLNDLLKSFKSCIKNISTFNWFIIVVIGFMIRPDTLGITSIVRAFGLSGAAYKGLRDFFRSKAIDPGRLQKKWTQIISKRIPAARINNRVLLVGDGTQRTTEGKFQAGQTKMSCSSNNQSRSSSFIGHFYGCVCVLAEVADKILGIPLFFSLQQGTMMLSIWKDRIYYDHAQKILLDGLQAAYSFGASYLILDRYFLSRKVLKFWNSLNCEGLMDIITRAKKNCTAYTFPEEVPSGRRGPKPKRGKAVRLGELFDHPELFTPAKLKLYGKKEDVLYYTTNLLWGITLYQPLRFVLAMYSGKRIILVSTDLKIKPEDLILAYSRRFKIEHTFKTFKNVFGGLCNHFWTKALGKKATLSLSADELMEPITDPTEQERIIQTVKAIDLHTTCCVIAMGLTQLLCLKMPQVDSKYLPYQRTSSRSILSERQMRLLLQMNLDRLINERSDLTISKIILDKKEHYPADRSYLDSFDYEIAA